MSDVDLLMDCQALIRNLRTRNLRFGAQRLARVTALAGIASVALALPAKALTFDWSFLNDTGGPVSGGTTSGTISGLKDGENDLSIAGIIAILTNSDNFAPLTSFLSGPDSSGTITVDGQSVTSISSFVLFSENDPNIGFASEGGISGILEFDELGDITRADLTSSAINFTFNGPDPDPTPVPGPLPLLGAGAAFRFSRRLRKRMAGQRSSTAQC